MPLLSPDYADPMSSPESTVTTPGHPYSAPAHGLAATASEA